MKRSYKQNCALAHALDVVGERWTLLIVRELLLGPRRYGELLDNLAGLGTNLLAARLQEMEAAGLIEKKGRRYRLSARGQLLEPVVRELVRFGLELGIDDDPQRLTRPAWDAIALRALYRPEADAGLSGRYLLELNGHPFRIEKRGGVLRIEPGDCDSPTLRLAMSKATARRVAQGELTLQRALECGEATLDGPLNDAQRLIQAFATVDDA